MCEEQTTQLSKTSLVVNSNRQTTIERREYRTGKPLANGMAGIRRYRIAMEPACEMHIYPSLKAPHSAQLQRRLYAFLSCALYIRPSQPGLGVPVSSPANSPWQPFTLSDRDRSLKYKMHYTGSLEGTFRNMRNTVPLLRHMTGEGSEVEPIVLSRGVRTWLVGRRAIGFAVKTFPLSRAASTRQIKAECDMGTLLAKSCHAYDPLLCYVLYSSTKPAGDQIITEHDDPDLPAAAAATDDEDSAADLSIIGSLSISPYAGVSVSHMRDTVWADCDAAVLEALCKRMVACVLMTLRILEHLPDGNGGYTHYLHRDLKLDNICFDALYGIFRVIDYGGACKADLSEFVGCFDRRFIDVLMTSRDPITNKFAIQSREGMKAATHTSSDTYLLGLAVVHLFNGRMPEALNPANFVDPDYSTYYESVSSFDWGSSAEVAAMSDPMRSWVLWALQRDPSRRPESASDALDHPWLEGEEAAVDQIRTEAAAGWYDQIVGLHQLIISAEADLDLGGSSKVPEPDDQTVSSAPNCSVLSGNNNNSNETFKLSAVSAPIQVLEPAGGDNKCCCMDEDVGSSSSSSRSGGQNPSAAAAAAMYSNPWSLPFDLNFVFGFNHDSRPYGSDGSSSKFAGQHIAAAPSAAAASFSNCWHLPTDLDFAYEIHQDLSDDPRAAATGAGSSDLGDVITAMLSKNDDSAGSMILDDLMGASSSNTGNGSSRLMEQDTTAAAASYSNPWHLPVNLDFVFGSQEDSKVNREGMSHGSSSSAASSDQPNEPVVAAVPALTAVYTASYNLPDDLDFEIEIMKHHDHSQDQTDDHRVMLADSSSSRVQLCDENNVLSDVDNSSYRLSALAGAVQVKQSHSKVCSRRQSSSSSKGAVIDCHEGSITAADWFIPAIRTFETYVNSSSSRSLVSESNNSSSSHKALADDRSMVMSDDLIDPITPNISDHDLDLAVIYHDPITRINSSISRRNSSSNQHNLDNTAAAYSRTTAAGVGYDPIYGAEQLLQSTQDYYAGGAAAFRHAVPQLPSGAEAFYQFDNQAVQLTGDASEAEQQTVELRTGASPPAAAAAAQQTESDLKPQESSSSSSNSSSDESVGKVTQKQAEFPVADSRVSCVYSRFLGLLRDSHMIQVLCMG